MTQDLKVTIETEDSEKEYWTGTIVCDGISQAFTVTTSTVSIGNKSYDWPDETTNVIEAVVLCKFNYKE